MPCDDAVAAIYGAPGKLPDELGTIIKCSKGKHLSAQELTAKAHGYVGKPFTSGADVYLVLYRTERGNAAKSPGTSSALVYVPDVPRAAPGGKLPVIVSSHGTKGQGAACASSRRDYDSYMNYPLVGAGYAVIAPDLAGYANFGAAGNPISAYASAADVGKSTLDGARALRKMFPNAFAEDVVIVGHSQGGGTALAALAWAEEYGSGGKLAGVVAYAPYWLSLANWGALPLSADFRTEGKELKSAVALWYMYGQGELHDGMGHGGDAFRPEKRAAVKRFVENVCWPSVSPVTKIGESMADIYDPQLIASLAAPAKDGTECADDLCKKWKARMIADRPHLTGAATKVPVLLPYGAKDDIIVPAYFSCTVDRLEGDGANYKVCYSSTLGHSDVVGATADYVNDWIAAKTMGQPEPAGCAEPYDKPACETLSPNEWR